MSEKAQRLAFQVMVAFSLVVFGFITGVVTEDLAKQRTDGTSYCYTLAFIDRGQPVVAGTILACSQSKNVCELARDASASKHAGDIDIEVSNCYAMSPVSGL